MTVLPSSAALDISQPAFDAINAYTSNFSISNESTEVMHEEEN